METEWRPIRERTFQAAKSGLFIPARCGPFLAGLDSTCSSANSGTVTWLHSDMLGSATLATNASGQPLAGSETRYAPFGSMRFGGGGLPHDRRFNGNTTDIAGLWT